MVSGKIVGFEEDDEMMSIVPRQDSRRDDGIDDLDQYAQMST